MNKFLQLLSLTTLLVASNASSAQTVSGCNNGVLPAGWLITNVYRQIGACGMTYPYYDNMWTIVNTTPMAVGTVLEICAGQNNLPAWWQLIPPQYKTVYGRCGSQSPNPNNVWVIQKKG